MKKQPLLLVISAPSGAGKTTLCRRMFEVYDKLDYSVSCTTRPPRAHEVNGSSYFFMSEADFLEKAEQDQFLEYARVHGAWYGTLKSTVEKSLGAGRDILMDIDVQGADQIRAYMRHADDGLLKKAYVDIFVAPPSMEVLEQRLVGRGSDEASVIDLRLKNAEEEMRHWNQYQYYVVNDDLECAVAVMSAIITAEHHRVR